MSLVTKVRETAGGLYVQAKARYSASPAMQRAGKQAGHAAGQMTSRLRDISGKASSAQAAGKLRDLSGKATSSQAAGKLRDLSGKATSAVKDARARKPGTR